MIPIRDENPTQTFAFVTVGLIAINVAAFLYEMTLPTEAAVNAFIGQYAMTPSVIAGTPDVGAYRSVFTSMFLHGGWLHLIGNMLYLWIFGNNIEDSVGHLKFLVFYLLCGVGAAAAHVVANPDSVVPTLGASGAVSGVLGAYLLLFPRARVLVLFPIWIFIRFFHVPAVVMLVLWFAMQLFSGAMTYNAGSAQSGGVAWWAHIGGFVLGMIWIPIFKKKGVRLFR